MRLTATAADLPPDVAVALANPAAGEQGEVDVGGTIWPALSWGNPAAPPVLLVHGVTSNAGIWWRVGPAIAAAGYRVTAIDMPGHGRAPHTGSWSTRFIDTAGDLARFIWAAGMAGPDLRVVGHSWGAMVSANLPAAGLAPAKLVLLDPPALTHARMVALTEQPTERTYDTINEAAAAVHASNPVWSDGDVTAKATSLTGFKPDLVLAVLLGNADWER